MRLGVIGCEVFARELSAAVAVSESICTVRWLPQGLHDEPEVLRTRLQEQIDLLESESSADPARRGLDAIALCYGLCGGALAGLCAGSLPLVIPRTDDCIGLLLGSQERYRTLFAQYAGVYWLSNGWLERANLPGEAFYARKRAEYTERFGEDNADWLMQQENSWIARYSTCVYIRPPHPRLPDREVAARQTADFCGWDFVCQPGCNALLEGLLRGDWDERYCVCPPGGTLARDFAGDT